MTRSILATLMMMTMVALAGCASHDERPVKETEVPKPVLDAEKKAYPAAKTISWKEEGGDYEAKLDDSGRSLEVAYHADGSFKDSEEVVAFDVAPDAVKKAFAASKHAKATVLRAKKELKAGQESAPFWKLLVQDGDAGAKLAFANDGKLVKEKPVTKEALEKWKKDHLAPAPAAK